MTMILNIQHFHLKWFQTALQTVAIYTQLALSTAEVQPPWVKHKKYSTLHCGLGLEIKDLSVFVIAGGN